MTDMRKCYFPIKRGSYIVEAAITVPAFIIAIVVMSSIILMYACIEDCNFIAASELRRAAATASYADTSLLLPVKLRRRFIDDHSQVSSVTIRDFGCRDSRWGQDELIAITARLHLKTNNPLGIKAAADYDVSLVTRAYVGRTRDVEPMSEGEISGDDAIPVYIFPLRGERYHSKGCTFLRAASKSATLTYSIRSHYASCPVCRSRSASIGSRIYYFPEYGESYHLPGCASLERNYIEIDRRDAIERGYSPCSKCGG